ncbi:helix-turn-helix domain-containing protein [Streptomyces sp. NPDC058320]|uniref:helix-turn-helix domain-containing protein n=1 Tax=unclassified Streptomyces TaxID=2593676 RepID=UPI0036373E10
MKTAYESGAFIRSIADNTGRSYDFVHHIRESACRGPLPRTSPVGRRTGPGHNCSGP